MATKVVNIQKEVNPNFKSVWLSTKPHNILKGGRNSFKSSVISLLLVFKLIPYIVTGKKANIVVLRKYANTIKDSVFRKMQWALSKFGFTVGKNGDFKTRLSPYLLIHEKTGSTIYFYGHDDFEKLKSNDIGDIIAVWYEETTEFKDEEEIDQTNITFMRQKHDFAEMVQFFYSYNPPKNPYAWINKWVERMKDDIDYLVHSSTYLDDELGFVTKQMLKDIEKIKKNDFDYYRFLYLGEPVGLGTNIYNMDLFNILDKLPDNERMIRLYFATDTGHSISATATIIVGYTNKGNLILLDTDYYSPEGKVKKRSPEQHCKVLRELYVNTIKRYPYPIIKKTIDSADGAMRNQYFNMYGEYLSPVAKKKKVDMIDFVLDLLAQGRFFILNTKRNQIFIEEHERYRWNEKSIKSNPDNPEVVKEDDHTCDAFQYLIMDNLRDFGLKF